ncbi:MAG: acyl carrier protein [Propionibacteriaceae bacterium]|nr:acyl carrier protein [Propionibacteriaceae bacterium]
MKLSKEELRYLLADVLDVDVVELTDDARFAEDLGVDSLMALEVLVTLEKRYQIKLDEMKLVDIRSFNNVYDMLVAEGVGEDE